MSNTTCNNLPSYEEQRQKMLEKIDATYNRLFTNYQQLSTTNERDKIPIQQKEQKLEELTEDLLNQLQNSISLIVEQHNIYEDKQKEYQENKKAIVKAEQAIKDFTNSSKAREDSFKSTQSDVKNLKYRHTVYLVMNIILLLVSAGVLVQAYRK